MRLYNDKEGFQMSLKTLNWQVTKISSLLSGVNLYELNVKTKKPVLIRIKLVVQN